MRKVLPPVINLDELNIEILERGASAALPSELSDVWLNKVALSLEQAFEPASVKSEEYLAAPLGLVVHILLGQSAMVELRVSHSRLIECLRMYHLEIALELVSRQTNIRSTSASLETIFTDRRVRILFASSNNRMTFNGRGSSD